MQRTTGLCASHTQSTSQWIWTVFWCCLHIGPNCMPAKDCYGNLILWAVSQCLWDVDWDWESKWFVYILEQTYPDPAEAVVVRHSNKMGQHLSDDMAIEMHLVSFIFYSMICMTISFALGHWHLPYMTRKWSRALHIDQEGVGCSPGVRLHSQCKSFQVHPVTSLT